MGTIGSRIKLLRKELKLTQLEFAAAIDIKQSPLSQIESDRILPSIDTLIKIKRTYKTSYDWLLEGVYSGSSDINLYHDVIGNSKLEKKKQLEMTIDQKIAKNLKPMEKLIQKLIDKLDGQSLEDELKKEIKTSDNKLKGVKN